MRKATRITVQIFGTIMGLAGFEHGLGEILQGNRIPPGLIFPSWPDSDYFRIFNGEPALSLIPNLLVSGILTVCCSLLFILIALVFVKKRFYGLWLMGMSAILLLVCGGIFPPVLGFFIGILATRIYIPVSKKMGNILHSFGQISTTAWKWIIGVSIFSWLALMPGLNILSYYFGVDDVNLILSVICLAIGSFILAVIFGWAKDRYDGIHALAM